MILASQLSESECRDPPFQCHAMVGLRTARSASKDHSAVHRHLARDFRHLAAVHLYTWTRRWGSKTEDDWPIRMETKKVARSAVDICCVKSTIDLDLDQCAKGTVGASWVGGARQALDFFPPKTSSRVYCVQTRACFCCLMTSTLGPRLEGCAYPSLSGGMKLRWWNMVKPKFQAKICSPNSCTWVKDL